jgi:hypothetical protein
VVGWGVIWSQKKRLPEGSPFVVPDVVCQFAVRISANRAVRELNSAAAAGERAD